jgi:hypothetical protein
MGTGQLPVRQLDVQGLDVPGHEGQRIVTDLVPQPAGSRVQHDGDLALEQTEGPGCAIIEYLVHHAHFQEMVSGTQGAQLPAAPCQGTFADHGRIGFGHAAAVFGAFHIRPFAEPLADGPAASFAQYLHLLCDR